jgi:hypothetical protein
MTVRRRYQFLAVVVGWLLASVAVLSAFDALSVDVLYILGFLGLLLAAEFTAPLHVTPPWRRRLRWFLVASGVGFVYLFALRVQTILAPYF